MPSCLTFPKSSVLKARSVPEMCRIPVSKWKSVFELVLFQKLRDDVDDTLVQKLTTFVESVVNEQSDYAYDIWQGTGLHESILGALDVGAERPAPTAFALRLVGAFSQNERLFLTVKETTQVLQRIADVQDGYATQDAIVKVSYLHMLSSFLRHRSGNQWAVGQRLFPKVFTYLGDGSIFVQNEAARFLARYIILNLSTDAEIPEGRLLLDAVCDTGQSRLAKRCLRVFGEVLEKNPDSAEELSSKLALDSRLLETLNGRDATTDHVGHSELLCRLLCARKDWDRLIRVVDLLEQTGKWAALAKAASTILQTGDDIGDETADVRRRCFEVLMKAVAGPRTPSVVSSALCALKQAMTSLRDKETSLRLLDCLASFLARSSDPAWARQTRILAVACECFRACVRNVESVDPSPSKAESYLRVLLDLLSNDNLSCHAVGEALVASTSLALILFGRNAKDFPWTSSDGLRDLGDAIRRRLVSTDPRVAEVALDALAEMIGAHAALGDEGKEVYAEWFSNNALPRFLWDAARSTEGNVRASAVSALAEMCSHDHLWCLLRDDLQVTESEVVRLVTTTAVADDDVFARRSAAAVLSRWTREGVLEGHGSTVRRAASESVAFDLDSEVQRCGLSVWRAYLRREMSAEGKRTETAADLLKTADSDGLGAALGRLLALDGDRTLRREAVELLGELRDGLHRRFDFVVDETEDGVDFFDRVSRSSERTTKGEIPSSTEEERYAVAEEVLDESVSESLRRKLVDRGDVAVPPTGDRLSARKADATTLELLRHDFETAEEVRREGGGKSAEESLLDDILGAAAAAERRDLDCY